ncbi:MAG: cell division protein FtsZ [Anaerolineae bacterium]|nr:cell division protein FtsZ [Anaerolineae bacterium]
MADKPTYPIRIKVIGVGGAGVNAISRMIQIGIPGVEFIAANTDAQSLASSEPCTRTQLGKSLTRGLGAGGNPDIGFQAALESQNELRQHLAGAHMIFIAAGMGGGTGTGAAPIVARIAREAQALTVAIVTRPFSFEGARRQRAAERGIASLREHVDTLIVVPNDRLLQLVSQHMTLDVAFRVADDVLRQAVQGIAELVTQPGLINLDFADVRAIMTIGGQALMSIGQGRGPKRVADAVHAALKCPLVNLDSIQGCTGVLVNITGGDDLSLAEVGEAAEIIAANASPDANIKIGTTIDSTMKGRVQVTLVATGIGIAERQVIQVAGAEIPVQSVPGRLPEPRITAPAQSPTQAEGSPRPQPEPSPAPAEAPSQEWPSYSPRWDAGNLDVPAFLRRRIQSARLGDVAHT